jgi:hypothetical protein
MASVALAAPVTVMGSVYTSAKVGAGTGLPLPAAEAQVITGFTGFSFPNNGAVLLRVVYGTVVGAITFQPSGPIEGTLVAAITPNSAISTAYIYGPFDTSEWNDANGLFQAAWTGFTGGSVGVYQLPLTRYGQ